MTAKDMREALEAAKEKLEAYYRDTQGSYPGGMPYDKLMRQIDAALSAVVAPVSEEEIARMIYDVMPFDGVGNKPAWVPTGNSLRQAEARSCARAILSRLSRTEGEWRPDPKTVDACAQQAEMCSVVIDDHDERGRPMMSVSNARRTIAAAIRSLSQPDPEESIRTRLDEQHVKSSGGVRTSTGKE